MDIRKEIDDKKLIDVVGGTGHKSGGFESDAVIILYNMAVCYKALVCEEEIKREIHSLILSCYDYAAENNREMIREACQRIIAHKNLGHLGDSEAAEGLKKLANDLLELAKD